MRRRTILIIASVAVVGISVAAINYFNNKKMVQSLREEISKLQKKYRTAKIEVSDLESQVQKLEEELANVQHFDEGGNVGQGYLATATNYTGRVLETSIDGTFEGWDGETIFRMMDGSIWQQATYAYMYHYAYMPSLIIYNKAGSYYMKVEGVDEEIQVRQIK